MIGLVTVVFAQTTSGEWIFPYIFVALVSVFVSFSPHRFGKKAHRINVASVLICPFYRLLSRSKIEEERENFPELLRNATPACEVVSTRKVNGRSSKPVSAVKDHLAV